MWANAQRDGRPAEYRWRPLFNATKFGWLPLLECRAVTLPRSETRWNLLGCPKFPNRSQPLVGRSSPYCDGMWARYCCLTSFFPVVDTCHSCEDMWADAQRDGHPAEYRWCPLGKFRNSIPCITPQSLADPNAGVQSSNAANIGERKSWTQSEFCTWQNSVRGMSPQKCIYSVPAQETTKHYP